MGADYYSRKSGQIPAFGDWENANELPITQYFECARQAGLLRCSCSGQCPYTDNSKNSNVERNRVKVRDLMDQPKVHKQYPNPRNRTRNLVQNQKKPSSVNVKPIDEDLYKISPELLQNRKRKKMLGFLSRCMVPSCAVS